MMSRYLTWYHNSELVRGLLPSSVYTSFNHKFILFLDMLTAGFFGVFTVPKICSSYSSQLAAFGTLTSKHKFHVPICYMPLLYLYEMQVNSGFDVLKMPGSHALRRKALASSFLQLSGTFLPLLLAYGQVQNNIT